VGVRIDEARRDDEAVCIDHVGGAAPGAPDLDDHAVRDRDIRPARRRPRAVHHHAVLDQEIEAHCRPPSGLGRDRITPASVGRLDPG
jgi:hypothetical protein